jgi:hypothetical protein
MDVADRGLCGSVPLRSSVSRLGGGGGGGGKRSVDRRDDAIEAVRCETLSSGCTSGCWAARAFNFD